MKDEDECECAHMTGNTSLMVNGCSVIAEVPWSVDAEYDDGEIPDDSVLEHNSSVQWEQWMNRCVDLKLDLNGNAKKSCNNSQNKQDPWGSVHRRQAPWVAQLRRGFPGPSVDNCLAVYKDQWNTVVLRLRSIGQKKDTVTGAC